MSRSYDTRPYAALHKHLLYHARRRRIPATLTYEEFLSFVGEKSCHYCGAPLSWTAHGLTRNGRCYNLDRMDSEAGYVKKNLVPCCTRCNKIKSAHFTYEQFLKIGEVIKSFLGTVKGTCGSMVER